MRRLKRTLTRSRRKKRGLGAVDARIGDLQQRQDRIYEALWYLVAALYCRIIGDHDVAKVKALLDGDDDG